MRSFYQQEARLWEDAITAYMGTSLQEKISDDIFMSSFKKSTDISTLVHSVKELVKFKGQHHKGQQHILRRLWKDIL